jgi:hypothetical protein
MADRFEGDNFSIERDPKEPRVVRCRVWKRPELDSAAGARCAEEMAGHLRRYAADPTGPVGLLFDLTDAPPIFGPRTEAALGAMIGAWERASKRVAVLTRERIQELQLRRVVGENAPRGGDVFTSPEPALAYLVAPRSGPPSSAKRR